MIEKGNPMPIRTRLPELRARHGRITLRELSRQTGITAANLSKFDRSELTRIDLGTLDTLCEFFNVGPGDILERVSEPVTTAQTK